MRRGGSFETTVNAFREVTAAPSDGAATRARVLASAGRSAGRRGSLRRASLLGAAAVVVCSSASVALTISGRVWRVPEPVALEPASDSLVGRSGAGRPIRVIPAAAAGEPAPDSTEPSAEERAYRRAHLAHFGGGPPAEALRLWDAYLAAYPRGALAPEARYNRAVCLVRLSRFDDAARALRSFADGAVGGYRQYDAGVLLDWMATQAAAARTNSR
jgi:hypothetical protein